MSTPSRTRLPNRRENETVDLLFEGQRYHVTIGFAPDGRPAEVFCHGAKVGSTMDILLDDACVALSLLLQHGAEPQALAHSMGRLDGGAAASVIGALVDLVAEQGKGEGLMLPQDALEMGRRGLVRPAQRDPGCEAVLTPGKPRYTCRRPT